MTQSLRQRSQRNLFTLNTTLLFFGALCSSSACNEDDADTTGAEPPAETKPDPAQETRESSYVFTAQVFGSDGSDALSYLAVTNTLEPGERLSLSDATEVKGRSVGVGVRGYPWLWVANNTSPSVTRYELMASGAFEEGPSVNFSAQGVSRIGEYGGQIQFVARDKAYYFDGATARIVVWNPDEMTLTGSISLESLVRKDTVLTFSGAPLRMGDKLIMFAAWRMGPYVPQESAIIVVDTTDDTATISVDERGGYVRDGVVGPDGLVYTATEAYGSAVYRLNDENAPPPCLLRFDPETAEFDPDFFVRLDELTDGATAGSLVAGDAGTAFLRVLDEEASTIDDDTTPRALASAPSWRWLKLTLGDEPRVEKLSTAPSTGSVIPILFGERHYVSLVKGFEESSIVAIGADGPADAELTVPGLVFSGAQL